MTELIGIVNFVLICIGFYRAFGLLDCIIERLKILERKTNG